MRHNLLKSFASIALIAVMVVAMMPVFAITATAAAGDTYELIKSNDDLVADGEYIIVCPSKNVAMAAQNGKIRDKVEITISDDRVVSTADVAIVTLEAGSAAGTWTIKASDGYLSWSSGNYVNTKDEAYDWNIDIAEDGIATIQSAATPERMLQYNASSPRFCCYKSVQTPIALFKLPVSTCDHQYGEPVVTKKASCTNPGTEEETCSLCQDVRKSTIEALGHEWVAGACTRCRTVPEFFAKISNVSELQPGDKIIIVAADKAVALGKEQKSNNRAQAEYDVCEKFLIAHSTDVQVLTLEAGTLEGTLAFNTGSGYLYAASSSSNYLRTEEALSDNSSWTIDIDGGIATIKAQGENERNWLRYNSSNSLFSCYTSGQEDVVIYKCVDYTMPPFTGDMSIGIVAVIAVVSALSAVAVAMFLRKKIIAE